jgi:hypothetical protein
MATLLLGIAMCELKRRGFGVFRLLVRLWRLAD